MYTSDDATATEPPSPTSRPHLTQYACTEAPTPSASSSAEAEAASVAVKREGRAPEASMRRCAPSAAEKSEAQWWARMREFQRNASGRGVAEKASAASPGRPAEE
jgi:hypothetical protein